MRIVGFWAGPLLFGASVLYSEEPGSPAVGLLAWMVVWWISESVSAYITALLPLLVLPLAGIMPMDAAAQPYGSKIIFLFLGGFMMAAALEKHQVHRQLALRILSLFGGGPRRILAALMLTTAVLSMWMSNTATVLMMLPIALAALSHLGESGQNLRRPVLLAIAYSASLGGMATLVGSPPNIALAGFIENRYGESLSFTEWLKIGFPVALILIFWFYVLIVHVLFRASFSKAVQRSVRPTAFRALRQPWSPAQKRIMAVMAGIIFLWLFRELLAIPNLTDHAIALGGGVLMFLLPNPDKRREGLLTWEDSRQLPWGILLLFGGGLSMASGLEKSGVIAQLGEGVAGLGPHYPWLYMALFTALSLVMTEFMSNVALVNVLVPVLLGIADNVGLPPLYLALPVTLAASCAFMFPIATPPNAVVYSTGYISVREMMRSGFWMNLAALLIIIAYSELVHRFHWISLNF
ncbi:MAG: SLC13 family permease [Flavobacteriales bacterium]|nr:SLC13 family permease [Flavobacteriales bacterium]